jgi:hypothetical protein
MQSIKKITQISNGNINISIPEFPEGSLVEIIINFPSEVKDKPQSLYDLFGKSTSCFSSAKEANQFIKELREEW